MFESLLFGITQGITEWLPISSEGALVLLQVNLFGREGLESAINFALMLHLGTALAAIVYLRRDIVAVFVSLLRYRESSREEKNLFRFLVVATGVSALLGGALLLSLGAIEDIAQANAAKITALVGILLLGTAFMQWRAKEGGQKTIRELDIRDSILIGALQGIAVLPGLSRSGLTVSGLLLRKYKDDLALRLSFLLSIPIVVAGNIVLQISSFSVSPMSLVAIAVAFVVGLATIHGLLRFAKKVPFALFVAVFGLLTIVAAVVQYMQEQI